MKIPTPRTPSTREVVVELYRGTMFGLEGETLEESGITLDAETEAWLTEQSYGVLDENGNYDPDLWVNIVPADAWAPDNRPIAERAITVTA